MQFTDKLQHAWNAFRDGNKQYMPKVGESVSSFRPDKNRMLFAGSNTIVTPIYNRIGIDCSSISIKHVETDQNGRFKSVIKSGLNECLTVSANRDQTGRAFIQDVIMSLCDEGHVAIVPVETELDPDIWSYMNIEQLRVAQIIEWYPRHVRLRLYNQDKGIFEEIMMDKKTVAIIENPLSAVMNSPNSTLQRLLRKISLLDQLDESTGSKQLDIIIQLPYVIKSEARKIQAENRRKELEDQLTKSQYGIAYTDGSEKITQLNRPAENNLPQQIKDLTSMLYSQLGLTENVFNGTADEKEMLNYYNRTIEPLMAAVADAMIRTFLTKSQRTSGQSIQFFRDAFKLVPVNDLAEIADKFTRNEILSSNEFRAVVGYRPIDDPRADELRNKNLNKGKDEGPAVSTNDEGGVNNEV